MPAVVATMTTFMAAASEEATSMTAAAEEAAHHARHRRVPTNSGGHGAQERSRDEPMHRLRRASLGSEHRGTPDTQARPTPTSATRHAVDTHFRSDRKDNGAAESYLRHLCRNFGRH